jgi:DNA gyrase/topoisomerase IV subunit B
MEFDNKDEYHVPHSGHLIEPLKILVNDPKLNEKEHGTTIEFFPDFSIMEKAQ